MTEHEFYTAIKGLAKGNKDMLHAIYDAYGRLIYTIVYDILKNREDAEDVTSEFFIKLIRYLSEEDIASGMVDPDCKKYGNRSATEAWA